VNERVVVAMSGGVDSSVAAALLRESGYDVIGLAMRLVASDVHSNGAASHKRCCSYEDFEDARRVAELMDFPFYVIDMRAEFDANVVTPFVRSYLAGRTPNPCVACNQFIKFDELLSRARALEANYVATGHYARIVRDHAGRYHLMCARDAQKDQSYFLFMLKQEQLCRILFPLGEWTKDEVRRKARALGLVNADKPESQQICFVVGTTYDEFVARRAAPHEIKPGRIVDSSGTVLGTHSGIHRFTVGQRRGLGVAAGEPVYVREIRPESGDVVVARREQLADRGFTACNVSLTGAFDPWPSPRTFKVKIRYRHPALSATVELLGRERAIVRFFEACTAVTPGQACVFYQNDEVVGGGIIETPLRE